MFSKVKCPKCGAKNSKERITCAECGAPLALGEIKGRAEKEAEIVAREAEKQVTEVPPEAKPNLASTMKLSVGKGRRAWFWVGVVLLTVSALFWLILIPVIVEEPDLGGIIVFILLSAPPIGIGIYGVRRGRKARAVKVEVGSEPTYPAQPAAKSAQRTAIGFFGKIKEELRDKTRDKLCAGLCAIGLDAHMAERGRPEEHVGEGKSKGLIEIQGSPIRWVNVKEERRGSGQSSSTVTYSAYLVPDPKMCWEGYLEIKSVRVKRVPIVGQVLDLRWESNVEGNLVRQLNQDVLLKQTLIGLKEDIKILSDPKYRGWIIVRKSTLAPSRELWNCYETVARHLVSDTFRPGTD